MNTVVRTTGMKPFNLAELRIAERNYCRQQIGRRVRVIAVLIALNVVVAIATYACKVVVEEKVTETRTELAQVQTRYVELKREIAGMTATTIQSKWQRQLADGSSKWLDMLHDVVATVPADLWLSRITSSEKDYTLSIDGHAARFESLSYYIDTLRTYPAFSEVRLTGTRVTTLGSLSCVDFTLQIKTNPSRQIHANDTHRPGLVPKLRERY